MKKIKFIWYQAIVAYLSWQRHAQPPAEHVVTMTNKCGFDTEKHLRPKPLLLLQTPFSAKDQEVKAIELQEDGRLKDIEDTERIKVGLSRENAPC